MEDRIARLRIVSGAALCAPQRILRNSRSISTSRSLFICMSRRFPPELLQLLTPELLPEPALFTNR